MRSLTIMTSVMLVLVSCTSSRLSVKEDQTQEKALLLKWMTGSFSSETQSVTDKAYYNIALHMYPIWIDDESADWLYVEQALNSMQHKPYRQRIYKVTQSAGALTSEIYELPNPELYIGKWRGGTEWDRLKPDDLISRSGCEVVLKFNGSSFEGKTDDTSCKSTLEGAAYATSVVSISETGIDSWDRGFDTEGNQVWGATTGPYQFRRMKDIPD